MFWGINDDAVLLIETIQTEFFPVMTNPDDPIIKPSHFKLPEIERNVILFYIAHHFHLLRRWVDGEKPRSFGPAKRFDHRINGKDWTILGGFVGAPLAAIVLENAIHAGGRHFHAFGTCGWIGGSPCSFGEVHIPAEGVDETGMAGDYGGESNRIRFTQAEESTTCSKIVSVNSFYRLTPRKLESYRKQNIDLIDMEAAPLSHICSLNRTTFHPRFLVSDCVTGDLKWVNGSTSTAFRQGLESAVRYMAERLI